MNDCRILITGGSGFIGTNLTESLISSSFDFINLDINPPKMSQHNKHWKNIDIREETALFDVMKSYRPTHVINLAADLGMDHTSLDNLQTNIKGVENIIRGVENFNSVKRVIFTSSLLVCENGYIPKSNTEYCPPNYYGQSKVIGEKLVRSSNMKCEWAIVRPTSIWGPWFEYSYKTFFKMVDKNIYVHLGNREFQKPSSFVGNTSHMLQKLLFEDNNNINRNTFYLADYPWYSTKNWANTIQETLNSNQIKTAPLWLLKIIGIMGDIIKIIFRYDPPLTSFRLKNMLTGGAYPIENTKEICGKLPFNIKKSVFITVQWMYENNLIKHKPRKL